MRYQPGQTALTANQGWRVALARAARKVLAVALTASLLSVGFLNQAHAQANANGLDPTFGTNGIVTTKFLNPVPSGHASGDTAADVVIQPDGKIIVAGGAHRSFISYFVVARYNPDGQLDKSFDSDGKQIIDFIGGQTIDFGGASAVAVALQPDGKIVLAGSRYTYQGSNYTSDFALARLNRDGRRDPTFGTVGKVAIDVFSDPASASAVAIQADGKIVVAGELRDSFRNYRFALARYNSDGSLDDGSASDATPSDSFGNGGKIINNDMGEGGLASAVVIQSDGKIVVAGTAYSDYQNGYPDHSDFALARYNTDGSPDTTFGTGGQQMTEFGNGAYRSGITGIRLQPDGKILAAGYSESDFALARYNTDGSLDTTFDGDGKQTTSFIQYAEATDVIILPGGKIMVLGHLPRNLIHVFMSPPPRNDFALARYNPDGSLDTTFDDDGKLVTDLLRCSFESAYAIAAQPDGKLIVAGSINRGRNTDFAVVRYPVNPTSSAPLLLSVTLPRQFISTVFSSFFTTPPLLGGTSLRGTVELCTQAPSDVPVALDDNLAAAHVPASVTVPTGSFSSTFTITSTPVTHLEAGSITASLGTVTKSVPLRVRPIKLLSLTLSPNPVQGSHGVTGVVVLERPAFAGGVVVTLSSSDTRTAYPTMSQITIAPGSSRRSFTIRTNRVPSARSALIRATANGFSVEQMLMVN